MASKEQILVWLDRAISGLEVAVSMFQLRVLVLALSFLKWARNDDTFLSFLDNFDAPPEGAITETPSAVVEGLRRWKDAEGVELPGGTYMELLGYILQIIRWISERKNQPAG